MAQARTAMIFSAELTRPETHVATVTRFDHAITISITFQSPETEIISEVHVTISQETSRDLAKKLVHRLSELNLW